jgi:hypothetical protein
MDFDKEVLDALAHHNSAPAAPTNIKTFKSVTPSARSPPPAGEPGGFASDSDGVHTDAYDGESDKVVSDEDGNPAYATRSAGHGEKQSMFTSRSNLSHLAPKVSKSASTASLTEEGLRVNKTLLLGRRIKKKLRLLCWEGSKHPGNGHTRTEAQTTCVPKTGVQTTSNLITIKDQKQNSF